MILDLTIENIILIESAFIDTNSSFIALTGESGSGKTAILKALSLLSGTKLDTQWIRQGCKKGFVQARIEMTQELPSILEEFGIPEEEDLLLSREISIEGKSRIWANGRAISLTTLQKISPFWIEMINQNSAIALKDSHVQKSLLDQFANCMEETKKLEFQFETLKKLKAEETYLMDLREQRCRYLDLYLSQKAELLSCLEESESFEALFKQYTNAIQNQEISKQLEELLSLLSYESSSLIYKTNKAYKILTKLATDHPFFEQPLSDLSQIQLRILDLLQMLSSQISVFEVDEGEIELLDHKLSFLQKMRQKYGSTTDHIKNSYEEINSKLSLFETIESEQELLEQKIISATLDLEEMAIKLSLKRKSAATVLQQKMKEKLKLLNMEHSIFLIDITPQTLNSTGMDHIEFKLNIQNEFASFKHTASGGEMARILFALKIALAEKNKIPTLIFDEIDAGIGGNTASMIGEALEDLSKYCQIFCVTHFPQVACKAKLHLRVQKTTECLTTLSKVDHLNHEGREEEIVRMLGGKKTLSFYTDS